MNAVAEQPTQQQAALDDELMTVEEVAARYKVDKRTIWRWDKRSDGCDGSFPKHVKHGGVSRWLKSRIVGHMRGLGR